MVLAQHRAHSYQPTNALCAVLRAAGERYAQLLRH
jgi:hypothetical protein